MSVDTSVSAKDFRNENLNLKRSRLLFALGLFVCIAWGLGINQYFSEIELNWWFRWIVTGLIALVGFRANDNEESWFYFPRSVAVGSCLLMGLVEFETILSKWHQIYVLASVATFLAVSSLQSKRRDFYVILASFVIFCFSSVFFETKLASGFLIYFGCGSAIGVGILTGLSRFEVFDRLMDQKERMENILNGIAEGFILLNSKGQLVSFNHTAETVLGISLAKGRQGSDVFFPWDWQTVLKLEKPLLNQEVYWKPTDEVRILRVNLTPMFNRMKQIQGVICTFYDVTEIRETETQVKEQEQMLMANAKTAALGEMAASISHEINSPMAVVAGQCYFIRELISSGQPAEKEVNKSLDRIDETVKRITKIIKSMRSLVRNGDADPMEPAHLRPIIEQTLSVCAERMKMSGISVSVEVPDSLTILCRPVQISQVVLNLLSNSFDAVENLKDKWIKISSEQKGEWVQLVIEDSGYGIPRNLESKIMEPFFTTKKNGDGSGLGLAISKRVAEDHGGKIYYLKDRHTKFVIEFPFVDDIQVPMGA